MDQDTLTVAQIQWLLRLQKGTKYHKLVLRKAKLDFWALVFTCPRESFFFWRIYFISTYLNRIYEEKHKDKPFKFRENRFDRIYIRKSSKWKIERTELIGHQPTTYDIKIYLSDHFGVKSVVNYSSIGYYVVWFSKLMGRFGVSKFLFCLVVVAFLVFRRLQKRIL